MRVLVPTAPSALTPVQWAIVLGLVGHRIGQRVPGTPRRIASLARRGIVHWDARGRVGLTRFGRQLAWLKRLEGEFMRGTDVRDVLTNVRGAP